MTLNTTETFSQDFMTFVASNKEMLEHLSSVIIDSSNNIGYNIASSLSQVSKEIADFSNLFRDSVENYMLIEKNRAQQDLLNVQIRNRQVSSSENSFSSLERKLDSLIEAVKRNETRIINNIRPQAQPQAQAQAKPEIKFNTSDIVQSLNKIADRSSMLNELQRVNSNLAKLKNQEITVQNKNTDVVQALDKLKQSLDIKDLIKKVGGIATAFEALLEILKKDNCITKEALQELFAPQREFYTAENKLQEQRQKNLELDTKIKENETTARDYQDLDGNTIAKNKTPQEIKSDNDAAQLRWKTDQLNISLEPDIFGDDEFSLIDFPSLVDVANSVVKGKKE